METLLNVNTKAVFNVAQLCTNQIIKLREKVDQLLIFHLFLTWQDKKELFIV